MNDFVKDLGVSAWKRALNKQLPQAFGWFPNFQDQTDTTHADVMAVFNEAIAERQAAGD